MARTPEPWFRDDRQAYFVTVNGTRHNLGPDKKEAFRRFHELMAADPVAPLPALPVTPSALTVGQLFEKLLDWCQQHRSPAPTSGPGTTSSGSAITCPSFRRCPPATCPDPRGGPNHKRGAIVALTRPFN